MCLVFRNDFGLLDASRSSLCLQLPWHPAQIEFDCQQDAEGRYTQYKMRTQSAWATSDVHLSQSEHDPWLFEGFPNLESYQVFLTHPLAGFYHRRDGKLGSYRVWHGRLNPKPATLHSARFELLARLNLVCYEDQLKPYSVLDFRHKSKNVQFI